MEVKIMPQPVCPGDRSVIFSNLGLLKLINMSRLLIYCCCTLIYFNSVSQRVIDVDKDEIKPGALSYLYTVAGTPFVNAKFAKLVSGSPFFKDEMLRGAVTSTAGTEYRNVVIRLNLLESEVNYLNDKKQELIIGTPLREVILWDTINNKSHRFIFYEFIETTDKPEKDFYELLQTGKAELYKQHKKTMRENRPYNSATYEQTIQTDLRFFVLSGGKWIKLKKLKDLPGIFPDKKEEITKFINDKKLSGDNEENFKAVIAYYNSLVSS